LEEWPEVQQIVLPHRHNASISLVAGISTIAKVYFHYFHSFQSAKPNIRIVVSQLEEKGEGLFPDYLELGWKSSISPFAHLHQIFDEFDSKYNGVISSVDLEQVIKDLGGEAPKVRCRVPNLEASGFNPTEFFALIGDQYNSAWDSVISSPSLRNFCELSNLNEKGFLFIYSIDKRLVDDIFQISEEETAISFIRVLEYTHTLASGKGTLPIAALWTGKVNARGKKVVGVLSGISLIIKVTKKEVLWMSLTLLTFWNILWDFLVVILLYLSN